MLLIPGVVVGVVALVIGVVAWSYDAVFVPGDAGLPIGLAALLAAMHWVGLLSAVQISARSRASAVVFVVAVSPIETFVLLWIRWATISIPFLAVTTVVLAVAIVFGAVLVEPPTVSGVTPGPGHVKITRKVSPAAVGLSVAVAASMFWWVLMLIEVLVITAPVIE